MDAWQYVWRNGFVPHLSANALFALKFALLEDDRRLMQGGTTFPPPLQCVSDWPVEAACALGYCGWHGEGRATVGEVMEYVETCCLEADRICARGFGATPSRLFMYWFDDTPRDEMRRLLLVEVERALQKSATSPSRRHLTEVVS